MIAYYINMANENDYIHCKCSNCGMRYETNVVVEIGRSSCDYLAVKNSHKFCSKCGSEMRIKKTESSNNSSLFDIDDVERLADEDFW